MPFICLAGSKQIFPGAIVLFSSDPDIEVGVDPGAGKDVVKDGGRNAIEGFADGDALDSRIVSDAAV